MASKKNSKDRVFDEMIGFLNEPVFQIPVRSFMDEHCLIFDVDLEPLKEHRGIFAQYRDLIDELLQAFCEDVNLTPDEAVEGVSRLNKIPDLHEMFSGPFEQVLASTDFNIFYTLMARHNIIVQEQVIAMLLATTGCLPYSLTLSIHERHPDTKAADSEAPSQHDRLEDQVMHIIIQTTGQTSEADKEVKKSLDAKALEMSQKEAKSLETERKNIEKQMQMLVIRADVSMQPEDLSLKKSSSSNRDVPKETPPASQETPNKSTNSEPLESEPRSAFAASLANLSPEELKQRQEFLRQQRDKLVALKKETREKQLRDAERLQSARPKSSRAARSAMSQKPKADAVQMGDKAEDDKKMAMRRAIAEKLRHEVIRH